jgi:serine protease Do/serine protease DegQ
VVVIELLRNSPADRAGVEPGDVVVGLDGRAVRDAAQLRNELATAAVGSQVRLTVMRDGRKVELTVSVEEAHTGA